MSHARYIICISNKAEYFEKEQSYKNSTKKVMLNVISSDLCNLTKKILDKFLGIIKIMLHQWQCR